MTLKYGNCGKASGTLWLVNVSLARGERRGCQILSYEPKYTYRLPAYIPVVHIYSIQGQYDNNTGPDRVYAYNRNT